LKEKASTDFVGGGVGGEDLDSPRQEDFCPHAKGRGMFERTRSHRGRMEEGKTGGTVQRVGPEETQKERAGKGQLCMGKGKVSDEKICKTEKSGKAAIPGRRGRDHRCKKGPLRTPGGGAMESTWGGLRAGVRKGGCNDRGKQGKRICSCAKFDRGGLGIFFGKKKEGVKKRKTQEAKSNAVKKGKGGEKGARKNMWVT